jgi:quinoprotein glucose dehydrogenase
MRIPYLTVLLAGLVFLTACTNDPKPKNNHADYTTWSSYLGGPDRNHYSTLSQITPENVGKLTVAWSYSAPDYGQMQMSPIIVDTILYGVTAAMRAFAVHAGTGKEIWRFGDTLKVWHSTSRGVSYWEKGDDKRILYTVGSDLYALNALTGKPIPSFGAQGKIDLRSGLPERAKDLFVISNTPGTIYKDLIVMPLRLSEAEGAAPGDVMAFNVITGAVEWVFHTIPYPEEGGAETWESRKNIESGLVGAANNWAGMAVDEALGIIYVPTGSAAPDFYGGVRQGSNLYANCLLALNADTGKRIWHFQFTHHDIWDRDPPAPPNLITMERKGKKIAAVAQVTKQGYVFVFDRKTGAPLFDIVERAVPTVSALEGEIPWATQPFPVKPQPFARQSDQLTENDISPYAPNQEELKATFLQADKRLYTPPGLDPVFLLPGYDGAAEWGGAGADPEDGILYVNSNEMAWLLQMEKQDPLTQQMPLGERVYTTYCVTCHQKDRKGIAASGFPSLVEIGKRKSKQDISEVITQGKGMMTGFPQIPKPEKEALLSYLLDIQDKKEVASENKTSANLVPYKHKGYTKFLDSNGNPGIRPPWGTLHAIDLNSGDYLWSVPFGETDSLKALGHPTTGIENYGGPVITENGLLFIGATKDGYFRVFDKRTGKILWEYKLPAAAFATPATYEINGKQYVVIACGGEKLGTPKGNQLVAFALP